MIDAKLQTFLCLCETKSYTKTAEILYITQPSVTNHIHMLEKNYGTKLFTSSNKNFSLTKAGLLLRDYALKLKALDSEFDRMMENINNEKPKITFSATKSVMNTFLSDIMPLWIKNNSEYEYNLSVDKYSDIVEKLKSGLIDFAIIDENFDEKGFNVKEIFKTKVVLAASNESTVSIHKRIKFDSIKNETLIVEDKDNGKMKFIEKELSLKSSSLSKVNKINVVDDVKTILELVKDNLGIGLIYEAEGLTELKKHLISLVEISDVKNMVSFYFIYNKNNLQASALESIALEFMRLYKGSKL